MSWCLVLGFELLKELGIQRALVADLELKNRRLRETAASSDKVHGDLEEQLNAQKLEYSETLRITKESLDSCHRKVVEAMKNMKADEVKLTALEKSHVELVSELNDRIATQDTVVGDLTDDLLRANRLNGVLRVKMEKLKEKNRVFNKFREELERFE